MPRQYSVTYDIVTPESAEEGDVDERGEIDTFTSLRDAGKALFQTRTSRVGGVECISLDGSPVDRPRWITVANSMEYETGAYESRSLHIPPNVTRSSAWRIARLAGIQVDQWKRG